MKVFVFDSNETIRLKDNEANYNYYRCEGNREECDPFRLAVHKSKISMTFRNCQKF